MDTALTEGKLGEVSEIYLMYTLHTEEVHILIFCITLPDTTFTSFLPHCFACADSSQNAITEILCGQRNLSFRVLKSHYLKSSSALDLSA